jgi:FAD/FMN-containing dehydrogenase
MSVRVRLPMAAAEQRTTRRGFIRRAGGSLVAASLAGELDFLVDRASAARPPWDDLAAKLGGKLIRPGDRGYARISRPLNLRYAGIHPGGVAVCSHVEDVHTAVAWAQENGVQVAVRSGGHNYAGYCTGPGLVVNVGGMRGVAFDRATGHVTARPGARNTTIYSALQPHGVAISAGRCPTVAVGGLVLGGGIGFSSRKMGLTCDHLISAQVVTADGRRLRCSKRENSDLFWALRGAGGGNFGVCTSYTFATNPVGYVTLYDISWEWADAPAVFEAFQQVILDAPDEFSARLGVGTAGNPRTGGKEPPTVSALGQFFGPKHELVELLEPALRAGRVKKQLIARRTFWQAKDYFFHTTPEIAYEVKSAYLDRPLDGRGVDVLLRAIERWPGSHNPDGAGAAMFASGGAINRIPAHATAFVHRNAFAVLATETEWTPRDSRRTVARGLAWIERLAEGLRPHTTGAAYQNFIDRSQPHWQSAYYGSNFERLTKVKRCYDPTNVFRFEQSIPRAR